MDEIDSFSFKVTKAILSELKDDLTRLRVLVTPVDNTHIIYQHIENLVREESLELVKNFGYKYTGYK